MLDWREERAKERKRKARGWVIKTAAGGEHWAVSMMVGCLGTGCGQATSR